MVLVIAVVINTSCQTLSDLRNGVVCGKNTLLCDRAMIRWTCNVRSKDHISSDSLLRKLGINNIQTLLRYNRLRWFGHVGRNDGCINSITEFEVVGQRGRGRQKKTWKDMINNLRHWKLSRADPANRMEWRKKLRTNIGAVQPTLSGTDTLNK